MNILPKKRWHVRTRENIARVRKDEAQAADEEKKRQQCVAVAEQEARTAALREKIKGRYKNELRTIPRVEKMREVKKESAHINLFEDLEIGKVVSNSVNEEHELEKKNEREVYEKRIGYLTYLGQDTVELTGNISWYNTVPHRHLNTISEANVSKKYMDDPLKLIRKYIPHCMLGKNFASVPQKRKLDKTNNHSNEVSSESPPKMEKQKTPRREHMAISTSCTTTTSKCKVDMNKLRAERLNREEKERSRREALKVKLSGLPPENTNNDSINGCCPVKQKYNSQFNPQLAKQNYNTRER